MEPQIIDYYNETPHGINVIDKLNEEYSELQSKYEYIKSITDRYIAPVQIAKNYDEYKKYEKILDEFPGKIREILNDKEYGLLAIYNLDLYPGSVYDRIMHNSWIYICSKYKSLDEEYFKDKIVNRKNKTKATIKKVGASARNLASTILYDGYTKGIWNPDLMMLMLEPVMYMLIALAEKAGIDYILYRGDDQEDFSVDEEEFQDIGNQSKKLTDNDISATFKSLKPNDISPSSVTPKVREMIENIDEEKIRSLLSKPQEEESNNRSLLEAGE